MIDNEFDKYLGIANHDIQMANTNQELKSYVASILYDSDKKGKEINRLNNIINELEKWLNQQIIMAFKSEVGYYIEVANKLKALKEE